MKGSKISTDTGVSVTVMMIFGLMTNRRPLGRDGGFGLSSRRHRSDGG